MKTQQFFKNPHLVIPSVGCILLIGMDFPVWFTIVNIFILLWRYLGENQKLPLPPAWVTNTLTLLIFAGIWTYYRTLLDREASPLFFCSLCTLKILEYKSRRDHLLVVLLLMFLLATKFLFTIDIWIVPLTAWLVYHLWLSLIPRTQAQGFLPWRFRFYFFKVALLSLPLAILLYFFFPRINSILIRSNVSSRPGLAKTGFGAEIRPGSISDLVQSKELVFRVELLNNSYLENSEMYWRGIVLKKTDGFRWKQGAPVPDKVQPTKAETVNYRMTMEPNSMRWTFPLDYPVSLSSGSMPVIRNREGLFQTALPYNYRLVLTGQSSTDVRYFQKSESEYLELPPLSNEVKALAESFKAGASSRQQIVQNIRNYFLKHDFQYTLNPGLMNESQVDDFLFKVRKGFCEHYASAFGILARAAGVPARVVIGFQGGEYNKFGNFYSVTSQDAHAWNEYLDEKGRWRRIDIVDVIAPVRIQRGAGDFFTMPEGLRAFNIQSSQTEVSGIFLLYEFVIMSLDTLNFKWTQWLLDFNLDQQTEFLKVLPIPFVTILIIFVGAIFFVFALNRFWNYWTDRRHLVDLTYRRLLRWAILQGCPKEPWEGPSSFGRRLARLWPERKNEIELIVNSYVLFAYADKAPELDHLSVILRSIVKIEALSRPRRVLPWARK